MSKLATLIRRTSRSEPAPMGFAAAGGRVKNPELLITVTLDELTPEAAQAAMRAGADALLLTAADLGKDTAAIRAVTSAVSVPCGVRVGKSLDDPAAARDAGVDFLRIDDDDTPARVLQDEQLGLVLRIDQDATDTFLRLIEGLPLDAVDAGKVKAPFTIRDQIELRRLSGLARKPLMVRLEDDLTSRDLEGLRDAGVAAVIVGDDLVQRLGSLRQSIAAMRPRRRRRDREDAVAVLPAVAQQGGDEDEPEEG